MPTIRKKSLRTRVSTPEQLSDDRICYLFWGFNLTGDDPKFRDEEEARRCWIVNKKKLMEIWFDEWKRPGQRPWGWWRWDVSGRRQRVGIQKWYDSKEWRYNYEYEEQFEFLERLGLLESEEVKKLPEWKKDSLESRNRMKELGLYFDLGELEPSITVENQFCDETMEGWNKENDKEYFL